MQPDVMVLLAATAGQSVLGPGFRVTVDHGRLLDSPLPGARAVMATIHPSAVLRSRTDEERTNQRELLVADHRVAAAVIAR